MKGGGEGLWGREGCLTGKSGKSPVKISPSKVGSAGGGGGSSVPDFGALPVPVFSHLPALPPLVVLALPPSSATEETREQVLGVQYEGEKKEEEVVALPPLPPLPATVQEAVAATSAVSAAQPQHNL